MPFISRQESFICDHCGTNVDPLEHGTCRNHCPKCIWSKHVDDKGPGDRASMCQGMMEPVSMDHTGKHGWMLVHRCEKCGKTIKNRFAPDDDRSVLEQKL